MTKPQYIGLGVALGAAIGAAIASVLHMGAWVPIGIGVGLAIAIYIGDRRNVRQVRSLKTKN